MRLNLKTISGSSMAILFGLWSTTVFAQANDPSHGLNTAAGNNVNAGGLLRTETIPVLLGKYTGAILAFIGTIFFLLMIYGGIMWMTSNGDDKKVTKAKDLIVAAVVGLIIVLSAYAITAFVGNTLTQ